MPKLSDFTGSIGGAFTPLGGMQNVFQQGTDYVATKQAVARTAYPLLSAAFPNPSIVRSEVILQALPTEAPTWSVVAYGNGIYIAMPTTGGGITDYYLTSPDGVNWSMHPLVSSATITALAYVNNKFIAIDSNYISHTSSDGLTWTTGGTLPTGTYSSIAYGNGVYVAAPSGSASVIAYSTDGVSWASATVPSGTWSGSLAFGNGVFVIVGGGPSGTSATTAYSTNGSVWTAGALPVAAAWDVTFGNGIFVALSPTAGSSIYNSTNGITWTNPNGPNFAVSGTTVQCVFGNGVFVAISPGNSNTTASYSLDGGYWQSLTLPSSTTWTSICFGSGLFFALSSAGTGIGATIWVNSEANEYIYLAGTAGQFVRVA
jgi:hypothetical protein